MALHGNRSVLHKSPVRLLNGYGTAGGGVASMRSAFNKHGMQRSAYQSFDALAAIPYGYYGGRGAWVQPKTGGAVAGINAIAITIGASGAGSMGKNTSGEASLTFDLAGVGGLISSASGVASFTIGASGNIFASKSTSGTASLTLGASGTLQALGHTGGVAPITFSAQWAPYAVGWLSGTTAEAGLTPTGIAAAVWNSASSNYNAAGTMGNKLNSAASGGVDLDALAQAVWQYATRTLTSSAGAMTAEQSQQLGEIWKIHGLDQLSPLQVTPTARTAGDIEQTISGNGVASTTVTRI